MWHELALTFDSKEKTLENLTLSGVSVGDAAVGRLAKCVSSGGQRCRICGEYLQCFTEIRLTFTWNSVDISRNFSKIHQTGQGEAD